MAGMDRKPSNLEFARLFKKYRLRSEIETLTELGDILAMEGIVYDDSLYTKWQQGTRTPHDRRILCSILTVFLNRSGVRTLQEANTFLESAGQGFLTDREISELPHLNKSIPFYVPREISHFTGRTSYQETVVKHLKEGNIVLIHGQAGVGKTALAISIAHQMKAFFPDGILWYQMDCSSMMDILSSIAIACGENISKVQDLSIRSSIVRSLTAKKQFLIVLDNVSSEKNLEYILPNNSSSGILLTSQQPAISTNQIDERINLQAFTFEETSEFFENVIGTVQSNENSKDIEKLYLLTGGLPLAIQVAAKHILHHNTTIGEFLKLLLSEKKTLKAFTYHDKNIHAVFEASFSKLNKIEKDILVSAGVFLGKDFSLEAVGSINNISASETIEHLRTLWRFSLVEKSVGRRYRIHPLVKIFVAPKITMKMRINCGIYFESFLKNNDLNPDYLNIVNRDFENIVGTINSLLGPKEWQHAAAIWTIFSIFMWHTGHLEEIEELGNKIYNLSIKYGDTKTTIHTCIQPFCILYYWTDRVQKARVFTEKGLDMALIINDDYLINMARMRLGRVLLGQNYLNKSLKLLNESRKYFLKIKDNENLMNTHMYLGELRLRKNNVDEALKNYNLASEYCEKIMITYVKNIFLGIIELNLGMIYFIKKNLIRSQEHYLIGLHYCKSSEENTGNSIHGYIGYGLLNESISDFDSASKYFLKAQKAIGVRKTREPKNKVDSFFFLLRPYIEKSKIFSKLLQ